MQVYGTDGVTWVQRSGGGCDCPAWPYGDPEFLGFGGGSPPTLSLSAPGFALPVQAMAILVVDGTITDFDGFTEVGSFTTTAPGSFSMTMYLLTREGDDSVSFGLTGGSGCFVAGSRWGMPVGDYTLLPPSDFVEVPDAPGSYYANPQDINNVNTGGDGIQAWVPTAGGWVAGAIFSATDDEDYVALSLDDAEGTYLTGGATNTLNGDTGVRAQCRPFVLDATDDPAELLVNEAFPAEYRFTIVMGCAC